MNTVIFHFLDQSIIYKINDQDPKISDNILQYNQLISEDIFFHVFQNLIKKNHLNKKIIGDKAYVIVSDLLSNQTKMSLKQLFQELQFSYVEIISEKELITTNDIHILVDKEITRFITSSNLLGIISTSKFISNSQMSLKLFVDNSNVINKLKILNYTNQNISLKTSQFYTYTHPLNFLIDTYYQKIFSLPTKDNA